MNHLGLRIVKAFDLTQDLFEHLEESSLGFDLKGLPSNRIFAQAWCIVGGRESYLKAIQEGSWQGFSCSLSEPSKKESLLVGLCSTAQILSKMDDFDWTGEQIKLAFDLLEHEVLHHGQLIRYVYANRLSFPKSWNLRYTV